MDKLKLFLSAVLMMCCMTASAVGTQPSGEGTPVNPYQIATKDNLLWFAEYVNQGNFTACAILTADITVNNGVLDSNGNLNGEGSSFSVWTPIGNWGSEPNTYKGFAGEFNGNGHTVSGLYFSDDTRSAVGLFGMADQNGYIHDVGIKDSYFRGKSHVAGICGDFASGKIENCWNAATVISTIDCAGGIAASCWKNASVNGCYNIGKVTSNFDTQYGGICGIVAKNANVEYSVSNCVSLEGKCGKAYNVYTQNYDYTGIPGESYETIGNAKINNVTIQNASAFANGTVCGLLERHSAEFVDGYIPTATTTGRYGHWHCRLCGKDFLDEACTTQATDAALTVPVAKNTEIWYTTTDNKKLTPNKTDVFGATYNDADNVHEKGLGKITFDTEVTIIGEQAFMYCSRLTNILLPNSVKEIAKYAFGTCSNLITAHLPEGVSNIGDYAFNNCSKLQSVTIPGSVKSMGNFVFDGCTSLKDVTIEDGAYIGNYVFQNYTGTLTINGSLSGVGQSAFNGCTGLNSVSVKGGSIGLNAFRNCTKLFTATLQEGVTSIENYAFNGCSQLQSITISGSVKSMGKNVFDDCTSLSNVTIEDGAYIGNNVFENYTGALTINGSLSGVGAQAFDGCTVLTSVSVNSGSIGQQAFSNCTNLSTATLDGVTAIGNLAFVGCSQLQSIIIPGSVKSMGYDVFSNCNSLKNVTIEDGAYIGIRVFQDYTGALTINGSLSGVGNSAFEGCTGLTSVSIISGSIGSKAFAFCTGLTSVSLLEGVNSIEAYAFQNCSNLKDIFVKWSETDKFPSVDNSAFVNVDQSNVTLHVPTNTTSLYQATEVWRDFKIVEDVNFIITKTDDTTIKQQVVANGGVTIDERSRNIKSLMVSEEVEKVRVTYYRNFANAGKWQAWYVPFDVDVADMGQAGLDVAEIYGILLDNSGNTVLAFLKMGAGTVKANTPYVVRPKKYGDVTVTTTSTLYPTKATQFAINSAKDTYTFGGIYEQTTTPGNWYAVNTSGQFKKMGTGVNLQPMRIWMTIDPRDDNPYTQPTEANAKMDIMVIGDDEPTGIESLTPTLSQGEGAIYNLNGQKVTSIQSGQVYIMNGKKYIAR